MAGTIRAVNIRVRIGGVDSAASAADLHSAAISEGFLPGLGRRFLTLLYRRIARSPGCFLLVAEAEGRVVGFTAGTENVARLYTSFLLRDGLLAAVIAAPRLVQRRLQVLETLRYPTTGREFPQAELLALAVAASHRNKGVGRRLVGAAIKEFTCREVGSVKVVVGKDNGAAIALYYSAGFHRNDVFEMHAGASSQIMTWP